MLDRHALTSPLVRLAKRLIVAITAVHLLTARAEAAEVCRFVGTTDYAGHVEVTTDASERDGLLRLDVTVRFRAASMLLAHIHYLAEEVSTWHAGTLESVAVNNRYLFDGGIVRQQWDVFQSGPNGLDGRRVQGKRLAEFRRQHPGFVQHWELETFGSPWLPDYELAASDHRPDLGLSRSQLQSELRTPLALAFYWLRWPHDGQNVPVFLPGFKDERLAELPVAVSDWAGGTLARVTLRYHALSREPASTATAWASKDGHLLQLAFELHGSRGSAQGLIRAEGCQGAR